MEINKLQKILSNLKKGVFKRLTYQTELPLKAEYRNEGYKVVKFTSMTTRFGIFYGNIKGVEESNGIGVKKEPNFEWVMKNNIQKNLNNDKFYLCTYPTCKGKNCKSFCIVIHDGKESMVKYNEFIEKSELKDMVIDSYWTKKETQCPKMMKINIENVLVIA